MGSMNFGMYPMLGRYKTFKHDWEPTYLESSRDWIFRNTRSKISSSCWSGWASATARGSSSSAMTQGTSTRSPIFLIASW